MTRHVGTRVIGSPDQALAQRGRGWLPVTTAFLSACIVLGMAERAWAAPKTVCTVTINSADERDSMRRNLPASEYRMVELVQRGNPRWLEAACRSQVRCDALVISGHFDDGTEFYTDRFDDKEFLTVHELQRASCSASCSGLFEQLREVYLFGCNTLKADPRFVASAEVARNLQRNGQSPADAAQVAALLSERYGQSNRDRLRHIFQNVPVLYGFSSQAPLGRVAGPLMDRYFQTSPPSEVAAGRPSSTLLSLFGPASMVALSGLMPNDPHAGFRRDMCSLADEAAPPQHKLKAAHQLLQRDAAEVRALLDQLEPFAATLGPAQRQQPEAAIALQAIAQDHASRQRFLTFMRDTDAAATAARMMSLAGTLGWLSPQQQQDEWLHLMADRMRRGLLGKHEVDLVCAAHPPSAELLRRLLASGAPRMNDVAHAAALACLGHAPAHQQTLRALTSAQDEPVAIAQTYLRHRPLTGSEEQRALADDISRMRQPALQVRALQALARQRLSDSQGLQVLVRLFVQTRSLEVQRAIADVLIRADTQGLGRSELAQLLRQHRLRSADGSDVIDVLVRVLQNT